MRITLALLFARSASRASSTFSQGPKRPQSPQTPRPHSCCSRNGWAVLQRSGGLARSGQGCAEAAAADAAQLASLSSERAERAQEEAERAQEELVASPGVMGPAAEPGMTSLPRYMMNGSGSLKSTGGQRG